MLSRIWTMGWLIIISLLFAFPSTAADRYRIIADGDPDAAAYVEFVSSNASQIQAEVYAELGLPVEGDTHVFVSSNAKKMVARAGREQGSTPPEWAAGLAYPALRRIYMHADGPLDEFKVTLRHELSHIAFGQVTSRRRAPRWFVEGLAVWQSEGFDLGRAWLLTEAATMGTLYPLAQLDRGFPSNGVRAGVAYAQAVHFIGYLHGQFGPEKFSEFVRKLRVGTLDFADAFYAVYQVPLGSLEGGWRSALRVRWGWVGVVFGETSLWVFASFLLILGWIRRRRERRTRLQALEAAERDNEPDELLSQSSGHELIEKNDEAHSHLH